MTAEFYLDPENIFYGARAHSGRARDRVPTAQAFVLDPGAEPDELGIGPRIAMVLEATITWFAKRSGQATSAAYSYGKTWDHGVAAFLGALKSQNLPIQGNGPGNWSTYFQGARIEHWAVPNGPNLAERALLAKYNQRRQEPDAPRSVLIGSRDHDALLAFDHAAEFDEVGVWVVLPASQLIALRHFTSEGQFPAISQRNVRTVGELLAQRGICQGG